MTFPRLDQAPELADLIALLRAHIARDEATIQALLVETRIDPFSLLAMLCAHDVALGARLLGSVEEYDAALADEQRQLRR